VSERIISYRAALNEALAEEMERDERVFLMGQDVAKFGGVFAVSKGLQDKFGPKRVFDTPISETLIVGGGVGAALAGARPVVELQYADFALVAMDEILNKAAKWRYMHGNRQSVPLVIRAAEGMFGGLGPEHSQSFGQYFWNAFGLKTLMPSTPADAKSMLKAAIRDDDPVLFLENKALYNRRAPVPDEVETDPIGKASTVRKGSDLTIIAWSSMVSVALKAAEALAEEGISAEVIDPRGVRPLDTATIFDSVDRTGRVLVTHEGPVTGGLAGELITQIVETRFDKLLAPPARVAGADTYVPQNMELERFIVPHLEHVLAAARKLAATGKSSTH